MTNQEIVWAILNNSRAAHVQDAPEELRGHLLEVDERMTQMIFKDLPAEIAAEVINHTGSKLRHTVMKSILKALIKKEK